MLKIYGLDETVLLIISYEYHLKFFEGAKLKDLPPWISVFLETTRQVIVSTSKQVIRVFG